MRPVRAIVGFGAFALLMVAAPARAQQSEADKLFDEATALMKQNRFADACPKFEASNKLDPEIGGLLWLADCYERNNQTASAYRTYKDAQKMALDRKDKQQRDKVAQKHIEALEPHLAKLTILAPQEGRPDGLVVMRDGQQLTPDVLGLAVPLDPGIHMVSATAPGFKKWEQKADVTGEGATVTVTIGPLEKEYAAAPPPKVVDTDPGFALKVGGVVVGAAGLVGLGVGSILGLVAAGKLSDSNANGHCDAQDTCDTVGLQLRSEAQDAALVSTILFVAGGAALVGGIIMFVAAPKRKPVPTATFAHVTPLFGNGVYGAAIIGRF